MIGTLVPGARGKIPPGMSTALTGTLTVRNVTMPVTLSMEQTAARARWFNAAEVRCVRT